MDTWLVLRNLEVNGERTRTLDVVKSRGMAHSNQVREFVLTSDGLKLLDVVRQDGRVLIGSQRAAQASKGPVAPRRSRKRAART
jgi:circadian clock protein KaiC